MLGKIFCPVKKELEEVEKILETSLRKTKNQSILKISNYLSKSGGKRIRPALVILSAKASSGSELLPPATSVSAGSRRVRRRLDACGRTPNSELIKVAAAVELIHMASLIHDDVIDHSELRHNKPTVNSKWGEEVSIVLGDYIYSVAFDLISQSGNTDILRCISSATKKMCEGELLQVCERDNLNLSKEQYIVIVRNKTAAFFAASCQAGVLVSGSREFLQNALKGYGLNFGIAFQIVDDCLDLVGEEKKLGKATGQDIGVGEITLPLLNLMNTVSDEKRREIKKFLYSCKDKESLNRVREVLRDSGALQGTKRIAASYVNRAKARLGVLRDSPFKQSLLKMSDFIIERDF